MTLVIAAAPILVAAVHNGVAGWYPAQDTAITAIRANDVFSSHPPLIGLPAFPSTESGLTYNYLGAPMMYLLAIPARLLGNSWGLLLTAAVLNTGWLVTAAYLIRRRVGYRAGTLACAFLATLVWGIGSQVLVDPTPVQAGIIASLTLMVAAWSVAEGDSKAIIPLALAANFTLLNHLQFAAVTPLVVVTAIVIAFWRHRKVAADDPARAVTLRRDRRRPLIGGAIVTLAFWIPPAIDQLFFPSANLSELFRAIGSMTDSDAAGSSIHRGAVDVIGVVSSPITAWPLWFRDSFAEPHFWMFGPRSGFVSGAIGLALVVSLTVFVMVTSARRGDHALVTGPSLVFAAWFGWIISGLSSATAQGWMAKYFRPVWPLSMLLWFLIVLGLLRRLCSIPSVRRLLDRPSVATTGTVGAVATVVVFAILSYPLADFGAGTSLRDVPIARQLHRDVTQRVSSKVPVLASAHVLSRPYLPVVLLSLQEQGIDFRFSSTWDVRIYGSARAHHPGRGPHLSSIDVGTVPDFSAGGRLVSATGPELAEPFERYFEIGSALTSWGEAFDLPAIPDDSRVPQEYRDELDRRLADILSETRGTGQDLLSDLDFVNLAVLLSDAGYLDTIHLPGVSSDELRAWFLDHRTVLELAQHRHQFVFVTFHPAPTS